MIVKKLVAGSLITTSAATAVILVAGMFAPASVLDDISSRYFGGSSTGEIVAIDKNGDEIEGAIISEDADGKVTVKDADGKVVDDAGTKEEAATDAPEAKPATPAPTAPAPSSTPAPKPSTTPTPTPAPAPAPQPQCGSGGSCTAAQVATHNSRTNCWVIHSSKVYNVTSYVSKHPGGSSMFNANTCGKNITAYLLGTREPTSNTRFNHSSGDIADINPYFIAALG